MNYCHLGLIIFLKLETLAQLALTMGFDALYRGQVERRRMANHEFRLYPKRPLWKKVFRTVIVSVAVSFTAWNLFRHNPTFKMYVLNFMTFVEKAYYLV